MVQEAHRTGFSEANCCQCWLLRAASTFIMLQSPSRGEGNGTPLQYRCLENPMDGGAWWAAVHGVARSQV